MAVLGEIRKRPILLMGIIALALLAFLVNPDSLDKFFGQNPNILGSVNDEDITREEYDDQMYMLQQQYAQQNIPTSTLQNMVWENLLQSKLIKQEFEKMGFEMTDDYFWSQLQFDPQFAQDSANFDSKGNFKLQEIKTQLETIKNANVQQYNLWLKNKKQIEYRMMANQVFSNVSGGVTMNNKVAESLMKQRDMMMDVDYVKVDYNTYAQKNPIKVTTKDLENYIKRFPNRYKTDANVNLGIEYFPATPSAADDTAVKTEITKLYNGEGENFTNTENDSMFVVLNSGAGFNPAYLQENQLPNGIRTWIKTASNGQTFGPYKEGNYYVVSKLIGKKADSITTYKVANLVKAITTSDATQDMVDKNARDFIKKVEGKSFNDFENMAKKDKGQYTNPKSVKRFDGRLQGLGTDKDDEIIAWAFDEDRKVGDVHLFKVEGTGDRVVVHFKGKKEKGLIDAESQRPQLEVVVRNEILAKKIAEKMGKVTGLDQVAKTFGVEKQTAQLNVLSPKLDTAIEPKVAGTAYGLANGKVSQPIQGMGGVYVIVKKSETENKQPGDLKQFITSTSQRNAQTFGRGYIQSLKDNAKIEDYRTEIFNKAAKQK